MNAFPLRAKIYIWGIILAGSALFFWNVLNWGGTPFWTILGVSVCAALSVIAMEKGATASIHYSRDTIFVIFAYLIWGVPAAMFVALFAYSAQWIWARIAWYRQSFNIASYFIDIQIVALLYHWFNSGAPLYSDQGVIAILAALAGYTVINHTMTGIVIWFAQGVNLFESGAWNLSPMLLDFTSVSISVVGAILWRVNPFATLLCLLALYPFFATLKIPALKRHSETDPKTGLYNARYFEQALQNEIRRAHHRSRSFSLVMADLDLLREVNNTYGHLAGDQVLIGVAKILIQSVREGDIVARFGGEEFTLLFPDLPLEQAQQRVEMIRRAIEAASFTIQNNDQPVQVTMSFGIAGYAAYQITPAELIQQADTALYKAKQSGRNRVVVYEEEGMTDPS